MNTAKKHEAKLIHNWAFSCNIISVLKSCSDEISSGPQSFTTDYHKLLSSGPVKGYLQKSKQLFTDSIQLPLA